MSKVAAIDIGTNTFLCLVANVSNGSISSELSDLAKVVRLGEGVDKNKFFSESALARAKECLTEFSDLANSHNVDKIKAVATSASRDVENSDQLESILSELGVELEIISGKREAELSYMGLMTGSYGKSDFLCLDIGGGSTEWVYEEAGQVVGMSTDIGSVRLTERFLGSQESLPVDYAEVDKYISSIFAGLKFPKPFSSMLAVAGTPTTLACMDQEVLYSKKKVEAYKLTLDRVEHWIERLSNTAIEKRLEIVGLQKGREDVLLVGAVILNRALKAMNLDHCIVSTRGVRYGVACEMA